MARDALDHFIAWAMLKINMDARPKHLLTDGKSWEPQPMREEEA